MSIAIVPNFIDGKFKPSVESIPNMNPATGEMISRVSQTNQTQVAEAVDAASSAFDAWRDTTLDARANLLDEIADAILSKADELAMAECIDTGKPLHLAKKMDIPRAAQNFRFFASQILTSNQMSCSPSSHKLNYTLQEPIGVVACISPWNLPLYLLTWKVAPALATGNCVIAKPSELTPTTAMLLAKICQPILPKGVLNVLHGEGAHVGQDIIHHPAVKAISFTGGTQTGRTIATAVAPSFKKLSLELGGKNPTLVFADCDLDKAVTTAIRSAYTNQGQICLCGSRILIQNEIYQDFKNLYVEKVNALKVANPLEDDCDMGAVISKQHYEKIMNSIEVAQQQGANILAGGDSPTLGAPNANGYFVNPTVIDGLDNKAKLNQEEIFGPVVSLQPFKDQQQAIEIANDSPYGLSASVWSNDISRCHQVAKNLDCGIVWINDWLTRDLRTPFGGERDSGLGREGGRWALDFFTKAKNICVDIG